MRSESSSSAATLDALDINIKWDCLVAPNSPAVGRLRVPASVTADFLPSSGRLEKLSAALRILDEFGVVLLLDKECGRGLGSNADGFFGRAFSFALGYS